MLTWPLASTALVVLTVILALGWYERSRPSARTIALVATIAALAVVGRIAFAPLPNVKPTTDLILFAGIAFGAIPGFAVGATAAIVSNIFFGQGLHTPWQMLAWGGVGVLGATARPLLGAVPGRYRLAALAGFAGLAFGAVMDFSSWATLTANHTLAEYGAIALRSAPFNLAHVAGNVVFALAFGPLLIAAFERARRRSSGTFLPRPAARVAAVPAAVLAVVIGAGGALAAPQNAAAATPMSYLLKHQGKSGGFGTGGGANVMESGWATMALGASGASRDAQRRAAGFVAAQAVRDRDPADLQRSILALRAVGAKARDAKGRNLTTALIRTQQPDGSFASLTNQTAFGILALRADGRGRSSAPVRKATRWLLAKAASDGGFSLTGRGSGGMDETAAVVQALVSAGKKNHRVTKRAVRFLRKKQRADGGFAIGRDTRSNAQSTAWAVQALVAVGVRPESVKKSGNTPIRFLRSLRASDGHIRYSRSSDQTPVWVTAQAQLALTASPFPIRHRAARSSAAPSRSTSASVPSPVQPVPGRDRRKRVKTVVRTPSAEPSGAVRAAIEPIILPVLVLTALIAGAP